MINLVNHIGTKYIESAHSIQIEELLDSLKGSEEYLDLHDARIRPRIQTILMSNYNFDDSNFVHMCDTVDIERDAILKENERRRGEYRHIESDLLELPEYDIDNGLNSYLASLDKSKTYTITESSSAKFAISTIVNMYRPKIKIYFGSKLKEYIDWVKQNILYSLTDFVNSTDKFIICDGRSAFEVSIVEKDIYKSFHIYGIGDYTWYQLVEEKAIIPSFFGNETLNEKSEHYDLFKYLREEASRNLVDAEFRKVTIKSVLEVN